MTVIPFHFAEPKEIKIEMQKSKPELTIKFIYKCLEC